jgi:hypothetical protein
VQNVCGLFQGDIKMKRIAVLILLLVAIVGVQAGPVVQGGCGQCADGAYLAGMVAFNRCRDDGESDEVAACCSSIAKLNYAYNNCSGCTDLINFLISHDTCMARRVWRKDPLCE